MTFLEGVRLLTWAHWLWYALMAVVAVGGWLLNGIMGGSVAILVVFVLVVGITYVNVAYTELSDLAVRIKADWHGEENREHD